MAESAWLVGEHGPGGDGEPARGHWLGAIDVEAFGGELAGQGDDMLVAGAYSASAASISRAAPRIEKWPWPG